MAIGQNTGVYDIEPEKYLSGEKSLDNDFVEREVEVLLGYSERGLTRNDIHDRVTDSDEDPLASLSPSQLDEALEELRSEERINLKLNDEPEIYFEVT